ncbi:hypothetical protein GJ496_005421 [Pomphorhynchus laevis]|nr:hypothetical protein GJ496_005421 [Pomphorhynchus laevis]
MTDTKFSILFVCLGNICRSPMAKSIACKISKDMFKQTIFKFDSAGTGAHFANETMHHMALETLISHGINDNEHTARQISTIDYSDFDYIVCLDSSVYEDVQAMKPIKCSSEIIHISKFGLNKGIKKIKDPYLGTRKDFEQCYEDCYTCIKQMLISVKQMKNLI